MAITITTTENYKCNGDNNNNNRESQICDKITKEQLPWKKLSTVSHHRTTGEKKNQQFPN